MPYDTPLIRRIVALAAAALFFTGVIGAFAVGGDSDGTPDRVATGDTTATTSPLTVDDAAAATSTVAGATPTTAAGAGGSGSRTGGGGATGGSGGGAPAGGASASPAATARPPQPGTYRFQRTIENDGEENSTETDVKIEAAGTGGGVTRQRVVAKEDRGTLTNTIAWTADAVRLELTRIESGGAAFDCDWVPDTVEYPFPLAVGKAWHVDSTCTATIEGQQVKLHRVSDFKVAEQKRADVGGTSVAVWVVTGTTVIETSYGAFTGREESEGVVHLAPEHGLRVYQKETSRGSQGERVVEMKLASLKPR